MVLAAVVATRIWRGYRPEGEISSYKRVTSAGEAATDGAAQPGCDRHHGGFCSVACVSETCVLVAQTWQCLQAHPPNLTPMKKLFLSAACGWLTLWTLTVSAFTYADGDLLLVFHSNGANDVEFNLGSVTNYLGHTSGAVITITNWSPAAVYANFHSSWSGVSFALLSATNITSAYPRRAYLTAGDPNASPVNDLSGSTWGVLQGKIRTVGGNAAVNTSSNAVQQFIITPTDPSSYTYIVTDSYGTANADITTLNGSSEFVVDSAIPGTSRFFEVRGSTPPANTPCTQVGSFTLTPNGATATLTFTAGAPVVQTPPPAPTSLVLARNGTLNTISFNSTNGVNYRLRYTDPAGLNSLSASNWTILPSVPGAFPTTSLQDTTTDAARFYKVEAFR